MNFIHWCVNRNNKMKLSSNKKEKYILNAQIEKER